MGVLRALIGLHLPLGIWRSGCSRPFACDLVLVPLVPPPVAPEPQHLRTCCKVASVGALLGSCPSRIALGILEPRSGQSSGARASPGGTDDSNQHLAPSYGPNGTSLGPPPSCAPFVPHGGAPYTIRRRSWSGPRAFDSSDEALFTLVLCRRRVQVFASVEGECTSDRCNRGEWREVSRKSHITQRAMQPQVF